MEFRLTYLGPLRPSQKDPLQNQPEPLAEHKQSLRRRFHPQIKRLWETTPMLQARWPIFPASNVPSLSPAQSDLGAHYPRMAGATIRWSENCLVSHVGWIF
jgi:hypothetical protein